MSEKTVWIVSECEPNERGSDISTIYHVCATEIIAIQIWHKLREDIINRYKKIFEYTPTGPELVAIHCHIIDLQTLEAGRKLARTYPDIEEWDVIE